MEKQRLQFDFTHEAVSELDRLVSEGQFSSRAELIRHSLRFLQWTLEATSEGATLLLERDGKLREVVFPFWAITRKKSEGVNGRKAAEDAPASKTEVKARGAASGD